MYRCKDLQILTFYLRSKRIALLPTSYSQLSELKVSQDFQGNLKLPKALRFLSSVNSLRRNLPHLRQPNSPTPTPLFTERFKSTLTFLPDIFYSHLWSKPNSQLSGRKMGKRLSPCIFTMWRHSGWERRGKSRTQSPSAPMGFPPTIGLHTRLCSRANSGMLLFRFWPHHLLDDGFG